VDSSAIWYAMLGGLLGGIVMSVMTAVARKQDITQMSIRVIEGAIFTGDADKARKIGLFTHVVVMSAVVIGGIYGLLFLLFDVSAGNAWWVGALFGVAHGLIGGVVVGAAPRCIRAWAAPGSHPPGPAAATSTCPAPGRSRTATAARPRRCSWSATSCMARSSA
jgi:hypothetical protein